MVGSISVEVSNCTKKDYKYNPSSPLIDNNGNFLRACSTVEMTRVIEISESILNPGKTNATDIPAFLFFDSRASDRLSIPQITIPEGTNKYHCRLQSFNDNRGSDGNLSGNYPDNPKALQNIISLHAALALEEIQEKNHKLPMIIVYQIGMNNNHVGIAALRICSITNPSQNEIMVINSSKGYSQWENAAVNGITDALKNKAIEADKEQNPKKILITPNTHNKITQASYGMRGSCSAITAAMSCTIDTGSFAGQEERLVKYMRTLCGKENEVALRRDHQKLLALSHSFDDFKMKIAKNVLINSERHENQLPKFQKKFLSQLVEIKIKENDLRCRMYLKAADSALNLYGAIKENYEKLLAKELSPQVFKDLCSKSIALARPELETHRGLKQILGNLTLAIAGLGIFYIAAGLINKGTTGNFLFFQTDSAKKIDKLENNIALLCCSL